MSSTEAARTLSHYLFETERQEILDYETVYYFNIAERMKNQ